MCPEEQVLNCDQPDTDDVIRGENQDEEEFAMIEESPSGLTCTEIPHFLFLNILGLLFFPFSK